MEFTVTKGGRVFQSPAQSWNETTDWNTGRHVPLTQTPARPAWRRPAEPGTLSKRPLRFFEALDGGFRLLRAYPATTFGVSLIITSLWTLVLLALASLAIWASFDVLIDAFENPDALAGLAVVAQFGSLAQMFVSLALLQLLSGFSVQAARSAFLGEKLTLRQAWLGTAGSRWRLIGLCGVIFACQILLLALCSAPALILAGLGLSTVAVALLVVGFLVWIAAAVYLAVRTSMAGAAVVDEDLRVVSALQRSWRLTGRSFWRTAGELVVGYLLSSRIMEVIITPLILIIYIGVIIVGFLSATGDLPFVIPIIIGAVTVALSIVTTSILLAYWSNLCSIVYCDQRMRREGLDLVLLRDSEGAP